MNPWVMLSLLSELKLYKGWISLYNQIIDAGEVCRVHMDTCHPSGRVSSLLSKKSKAQIKSCK